MSELPEEKIIALLNQIINERDQGKPTGWMRNAVVLLVAGVISVTGTTTTILTYKPEDIAAIASSADFRSYKQTVETELTSLQSQMTRLVAQQQNSSDFLEQLRKCQQNMTQLQARMTYFEQYQNLINQFGGNRNAE
ncbi:MAG: hypothetical protein AB2747_05365 [Candidatus Thiodiazotropha taylori]